MKAVVLDFVEAEGTRTHLNMMMTHFENLTKQKWPYINMLLCSVENMSHSNALGKIWLC